MDFDVPQRAFNLFLTDASGGQNKEIFLGGVANFTLNPFSIISCVNVPLSPTNMHSTFQQDSGKVEFDFSSGDAQFQFQGEWDGENLSGTASIPQGYYDSLKSFLELEPGQTTGDVNVTWSTKLPQLSPPTVFENYNALALGQQWQLKTNWCWAAVTTTVALFYNPASELTQCQLVHSCLFPGDVFNQIGCCNSTDTSEAIDCCNQEFLVDDALLVTGNLSSHQKLNFSAQCLSDIKNRNLSPASINELLPNLSLLQTEISNGRPVIARLDFGFIETGYETTSGHFVIVVGVEKEGPTEQSILAIVDPKAGLTRCRFIDLMTNYPNEGVCTDLYLTSSHSTSRPNCGHS